MDFFISHSLPQFLIIEYKSFLSSILRILKNEFRGYCQADLHPFWKLFRRFFLSDGNFIMIWNFLNKAVTISKFLIFKWMKKKTLSLDWDSFIYYIMLLGERSKFCACLLSFVPSAFCIILFKNVRQWREGLKNCFFCYVSSQYQASDAMNFIINII